MATRKRPTRITKAELSKVMRALGHRGGLARAKNRTAEELSAIGRRGAIARYGSKELTPE